MQDEGYEQSAQEQISWSASEFVQHHKNISWFMVLGGASALAAILTYLMTKDVVATGSVVAILIIFGIYSTKTPAEMNYTLDDAGIWVGETFHPYESFEGFSIVNDGMYESIYLVTNHRFKVPMNLYFPPEQGQAIFDRLSMFIPFSDRSMSVTDTLMSKLKF